MPTKSRLSRIQSKFRNTTLEQLDTNGTWTEWLPDPGLPAKHPDNKVKMFDVDRFLTIYNRPEKRRQISHIGNPALPTTGVLRNPVDGAVYIVGSERNDTNANETVEGLTTVHKVDSGQLSQVKRKEIPATRPAHDPGHAVVTDIGLYLFDLELRSVRENDGEGSSYTPAFFCFTSCPELKENDQITIDGQSYMVQTPYKDTGFYAARVVKLPDTREDIIYEREYDGTDDEHKYNPYNNSQGQGHQEYQITAWIGFTATQCEGTVLSDTRINVFIDYDFIGFTPSVSDKLQVGGRSASVEKVIFNPSLQQYHLECEIC